MFCQKCGGAVAEDAKFCNGCGEATPLGASTLVSSTGIPLMPASVGKRIGNYFLDWIGTFVFGLILMAIFVALGLEESTGASVILGILYTVGYYIFFEAIWQRTPAKWITGTKVVRYDGKKPTFPQILGRSFARLIPFEPFSFLFEANPVGWHDRLPKTLVVPSSLTEEDVQKFKLEEIKKKKNSTALIIVMFVVVGIAVLGILASIILASLGAARDKAQEAKMKAEQSSYDAQMDLYDADYAG
ncbi:MAG: RDD family protein [Candidatus Pacebacteria bacterium]|nr:RDD family protein [Candidatus Paceibacterota bacterium]